MDITVFPGRLRGTVTAIPSKSVAHRMLICAGFAKESTQLVCPEINRDIEATARCLQALGVGITRTDTGYKITPALSIPQSAVLPCGESGSTLRFFLPVVGALGVDATFCMEGRLPQRPLSPLWEEMERMGCSLCRPTETTLHCCGQLKPGSYTISGGVSSQFITGLLLAFALMKGNSSLSVTGKLESKPYIDITMHAMAQFGVDSKNFVVNGTGHFRSPGTIAVEGDWSNAAFFLTAAALGNDITTANLDPHSPQGDRAIAALLPQLKNHCTVCAADIPDLIPILAVYAAANQGAIFTDTGRLRLKESDRVASVIWLLEALGGKAEATEDTLTVYPARLTGGVVDACGDHRIAMAAAIAATVSNGPVTIFGSQCVEKSYPSFWEVYQALGGCYEQYIR